MHEQLTLAEKLERVEAALRAAEEEHRRLLAAEQLARIRIGRMQEVTAALSRARTAEEVADVACRIGMEAMAASSGALWIVGADGALHLAGSCGIPPAFLDQFRVLAADSHEVPAVEVVKTGEPLWIETEDDYRRASPLIFETAKAAGRLAAYGAVPLLLGGQVAGVVCFAHAVGHRYDADERTFYVSLAAHCSHALERARLLDAERRSNERLSLLARAREALFTSSDVSEALAALARLMVPAFADWAAVYMLDGDDLRPLAIEHPDPGEVTLAMELLRLNPPKLSDPQGMAAPLITRQIQWIPRISPEMLHIGARSSAQLQILLKLGLCSLLAVPIFAGGQPMGVAHFVTTSSGRIYDEADRAFAAEVAQKAGIAIDRARLYASARDAARRAEEANRIKDEFLATVSHELRTPLNAISGWTTLLRQKGDDPAVRAKGLDVIARNTEVQVKLVEDILDVSRIISGKLKIDARPVDMVAIVKDALDVVRPSASAKQISLTLDLPPHTCLVVGDAQRLQQVVWNLLSNAVKFTRSGGRVTITLVREGSTVTFSVADTGKGIAAEFLPHVFERFQQADSSTTRRFGGLGLGLAIVRHIVELHGGRATAESAGAGLGATFRILLPVRAVVPAHTEERPSAVIRSEQKLPVASIKGLRILVVDDELDAREMLQELLEAEGGVVAVAASSRAGLEALPRFRPDVIVSDIGMPEEDGYAFIARARSGGAESGARTPAVALTAYARREDERRALEAGFDTHVAKPVDFHALLAVLARLAAEART